MAKKTLSRTILIVITLAVVAAGLSLAFWPRPVLVDIGQVSKGRMVLTIDEKGRTRVRDVFVVSTPMNGRLLRVEVEPGDPVERDATVVARMRPANPTALDVRTREQATAAVEAAEAALRLSEASLDAARADADLAIADLERTRRLAASGTASIAALDRAAGAARAAEARLGTAEAAVAQRKAELQSAQAQLIGFDDRRLLDALEAQLGEEIPIFAPTDGVILRVINEDETTLAAGAPILEVGDVLSDLEVVAELISTDAVQVEEGNPVIIENWGGEGFLSGVVTRISPFGQTKLSALGVEEQRVTVEVSLTSTRDARRGLGHGYSVDARIVVRQTDDALLVPSSALFRDGSGWSVFVVRDGVAESRAIEIAADNGREAEVLQGVVEGDRVVLYPPSDLESGSRIAERDGTE